MRKILVTCCLLMSLSFSFCTFASAVDYDFANMTREELEAVKKEIDNELSNSHSSKSDERKAVENATKSFVEKLYNAENVDWAWVDYTHTKDWDFYTLKTHADITKPDGGRARYEIYSELFKVESEYITVYIKIGNEEILNQRDKVINDPRILKKLGIISEVANVPLIETETLSDNAVIEEPIKFTDTLEPEVMYDPTPVAKKNEKNDTVKHMQNMLSILGYLKTTPDGMFGDNTMKALKAFQKEYNFPEEDYLSKSVYEAIQNAVYKIYEPEQTQGEKPQKDNNGSKSVLQIRDEFIASAEVVSYEELRRYPDSYRKKNLKLSVYINEVETDGFITNGRIKATYSGGTICINDRRTVREPRLMQGDTITIYGNGAGLAKITTYVKGSGLFGSDLNAEVVNEKEIPAIDMIYTEKDNLSAIAAETSSNTFYENTNEFEQTGRDIANKLNQIVGK